MKFPLAKVLLLLVGAFSLATWLEGWRQTWAGNRDRSAGLMAMAFGDSRRLFARHFFVKADVYLHNGYYPTIYDNGEKFKETHLTGGAGLRSDHDANEGKDDFLGRPLDWIDRFGRHFYPSHHSHLGETEGEHEEHKRQDGADRGVERELLPWLRVSASLDPTRIETFTTAAYWLRSRLNKVAEAEQFLREGLQANPESYEILFELGRIYRENKQDPERARNLWELALRRWREQENPKADRNILLYAEIVGNLAKLEEESQRYPLAIGYLTLLKQVSPYKDSVQKWIGDLQQKSATR